MAPEAAELGLPLRHLVVGEYRALFSVRGRAVFVLHVRHGQRQPAMKEELGSALGELHP